MNGLEIPATMVSGEDHGSIPKSRQCINFCRRLVFHGIRRTRDDQSNSFLSGASELFWMDHVDNHIGNHKGFECSLECIAATGVVVSLDIMDRRIPPIDQSLNVLDTPLTSTSRGSSSSDCRGCNARHELANALLHHGSIFCWCHDEDECSYLCILLIKMFRLGL